jgi:predicted DNA-binding protein (MmcQ/YjbR family)
MPSLEQICLSLPDTSVSFIGGSPHYKVSGQIFCGGASPRESPRVTLRLDDDHADMRLATDPRFEKTKYGPGVVKLRLDGNVDWKLVRELVEESYRLALAAKAKAKKPARKPAPKAKPKTPAKAKPKARAR